MKCVCVKIKFQYTMNLNKVSSSSYDEISFSQIGMGTEMQSDENAKTTK